MKHTQTKVVPLEYLSMGTSPSTTAWQPLIADEGQDHAQMLLRVQHLEAENGELLRNSEQQLAAARSEAYEAARRQVEEQTSNGTTVAIGALMRAIEGFSSSRDQYFAEIELEVVRLALAIAARILHREAQMDPLLLSGAVKVALGQLSESTEVHLRIPAAESGLWTEMLRLMPNLPLRPAIVPDDHMRNDECRLETKLGSVDLGVRAQLAEIERGFFDLLEHRTKARHAATA